jgi:hypothetical protein
MNPNEEALMEVDWVIQESYKRAIKLRGIGDWSDFTTVQSKEKAQRDIEQYQLVIAKLISDTLIEKQHVWRKTKKEGNNDGKEKYR